MSENLVLPKTSLWELCGHGFGPRQVLPHRTLLTVCHRSDALATIAFTVAAPVREALLSPWFTRWKLYFREMGSLEVTNLGGLANSS